jgi:hypothetical protein
MTRRKIERDAREWTSETRVKRGRGHRLLSALHRNPVVGLFSVFCTVAGFFLGLYFQFQTSPKLVFAVKPGRLEIASGGQSPHLSFQYKGFPIKGDLTSARVALWNAGRVPIKREDVPKPIVIYTTPPTAILDVVLKPFGHTDITEFTLDARQLPQGRLPVRWTVLPKQDGAFIDLIYNGPPDVKIAVSGLVLGQDSIEIYQNEIGFASPAEEYEAERKVNKRQLALVPVLMLGSLLGFFASTLRARRETNSFARRTLIALAVTCVLMMLLSAVMYWTSRYPTPPPALDEVVR